MTDSHPMKGHVRGSGSDYGKYFTGESRKPTIYSSTQEEKFLMLKRPFVVLLIIDLIEKLS